MSQPIEALSGAPEGEVELGHVERELAALWAAPPGEPEEEPAVLRACALNLVVLGCSLADLERVRPLAERITLDHPARILTLAPVLDGPAGIGAQVSAFCHRLDTGGRHVCCEEITVLARGAAAGRLPEAALPLLLPDMPVYLWIPGRRRLTPPAGSNRTDTQLPPAPTRDWRLASGVWRLVELADAVIWSARGAEDQLPAARTRARPPVAMDLDWLRILPWLELTAQLFDSPDRRPLLERLEAVEVVVAGSPAPLPGAGWLWLGWLASRLGWESLPELMDSSPAGGSHGAIQAERRLRARARAITARVLWDEAAEVAAGELLAVRLHPQGAPAALALERQPAPDPADLWIYDGASRCVHLGIRDESALLGEALDRTARDPIYEAAWDAAVRLWRGEG
jgi:glucose-6-phosphate dehydrogenase assembly protein OpcA